MVDGWRKRTETNNYETSVMIDESIFSHLSSTGFCFQQRATTGEKNSSTGKQVSEKGEKRMSAAAKMKIAPTTTYSTDRKFDFCDKLTKTWLEKNKTKERCYGVSKISFRVLLLSCFFQHIILNEYNAESKLFDIHVCVRVKSNIKRKSIRNLDRLCCCFIAYSREAYVFFT